MPTTPPSGPTPLSPARAREIFKNGNPWPTTLAEAQRLARTERLERNESPETKKANAQHLARLLKGRKALINTAAS